MHEPPNLPDDAIITALEGCYGISVTSLTFLPIGYDSTAWVYRAEAVDGVRYFCKVRAGLDNLRGIVIPRFVKDSGVPHIVAPLPTNSRALWATVNDFALILYPFIDGRTGVESSLSDDDWTALGALVKQVHSLSLPPDLLPLVRRDPFTPVRRDLVPTLDQLLMAPRLSDPIARELAAHWRAKREDIHMTAARWSIIAMRGLCRTLLPMESWRYYCPVAVTRLGGKPSPDSSTHLRRAILSISHSRRTRRHDHPRSNARLSLRQG